MTHFTRWPLLLVLIAVASGVGARSLRASGDDAPAEAINAFLARFDAQTRAVMNEAPSRWDEHGNLLDPNAPENLRFSRESIENGEAIAERDRDRSRMCMEWQGKKKCLGPQGGRSEIQGSDLPEALADNGEHGLIRSLEEMESEGLRRASLSDQPWSGDYWGHYKGIVAARYADPYFPGSNPEGNAGGYDWASNRRYVLNRPASVIAERGSDAQVDLLSPSEKYELLIGDSGFSMTEKMWSRGQRYYEEKGKVETWMGICHGWAPAAMMLPRPSSTVSLQSADGSRTLQFYPSDTKALASLLWAEGDYATRFVGGRCSEKDPETDANGRVVSQKCFDTNPGTWHLAVVNQLGVSRRSLVMDASLDYQVWNQPAYAYSYHYFNPQTMYFVNTLREARVPMERFARDKFRAYRSPKAAAVVGIAMDFTYVAETYPTHARTDSYQRDRLRTVRYYYDVELDESGNIIGGEWYQNKHPDFLWLPTPGARAISDSEDQATGRWNPNDPLPASWQAAARDAATNGQPLAKIIEALVELTAPQR